MLKIFLCDRNEGEVFLEGMMYMKKFLCVAFLIACVSFSLANQVTLKNDTNNTYFTMCGDIGQLLEPGRDFTCSISEAKWWQRWWNEPTMLVYRKGVDKFYELFHIKPKGEKVTISLADVHREVKKYHEEKEKKNIFEPIKCWKCHTENPATHKFCGLCGAVLEEKTARKIVRKKLKRKVSDKVMDTLIGDKDFQDYVDKKLKEHGYIK